MTTIDLIAQEHVKYLASAKTRRDRDRYLAAVERLRAEREGQRSSPSARTRPAPWPTESWRGLVAGVPSFAHGATTRGR
jgi:hypothetical protein